MRERVENINELTYAVEVSNKFKFLEEAELENKKLLFDRTSCKKMHK